VEAVLRAELATEQQRVAALEAALHVATERAVTAEASIIQLEAEAAHQTSIVVQEREMLLERQQSELLDMVRRHTAYCDQLYATYQEQLQAHKDEAKERLTLELEKLTRKLENARTGRQTDAEQRSMQAESHIHTSERQQLLLRKQLIQAQQVITTVQLKSKDASAIMRKKMHAVEKRTKHRMQMQTTLQQQLLAAEEERKQIYEKKLVSQYRLLSMHLKAELERDQLLMEARARRGREQQQRAEHAKDLRQAQAQAGE
jgi:hypothetical protein